MTDPIKFALHGDLRPLVALLRSNEPLGRDARDYIADEIEREPDKRFRRRKRADLSVKKRDRDILFDVWSAKMDIVLRKLGSDTDGCEVYEALDKVSDAAALNYLQERYGIEIDADALKNALTRSEPGIFDPRGARRAMRKLGELE